MLFPSAFGIMCSKTGFTCSRFCASPGETPSDIAVTISPNKPVRITLRICLPPQFGASQLFTLSLLCGIREGRSKHQIDGVGALKIGDKSFTDRGVHRAESGGGFVRKAPKVFLEESFLEAFARIAGHDFVAQLRRKLIKPFSEDVKKNTRLKQSYFRAHVVSDARGGVQGNSLPGSFYLLFGDVMCGEELTDRVCAIDLEAFGCARALLDETEIVKCGRDVEKFRVEAKLLLTAVLSRK